MQADLGTIVCKFGRKRAICLREKAILGQAQKCPYHVTFDLDLDLDLENTPWMQADLGTIVCTIGRKRAICLREKAILVQAQKCPYHVTFDLDLDLERTLDAG